MQPLPISITPAAAIGTQQTQKPKSRRIVLQPSSRLNPSVAAPSQKGSVPISSLSRIQEGTSFAQVLKSVTKGSEKASHSSKSQSAVKRQRSALWIAKAQLLNMNLTSQAAARVVLVNPNTSMQGAAPKDTPNVLNLASPKGTSKTQGRAAQQYPPAAMSPNVLPSTKYKRQTQQQQSTRQTVEKIQKKRAIDFSLFNKVGAAALNSHFVIPSAKVGEVFSSIAKGASSRVVTNREIAQMLRISATHKGSRKKRQIPSAKQILSSIGLHSVAAAGNHTSFNWPTAKQQPQTSGKATVLIGKSRRHSQSRLEISEGPLHQIVNTKRSANNFPIHKFKKRHKQQMSGHPQYHHLQESLFQSNNGGSQTREVLTRAGTNQSRAKAAHQSRSKSRSPAKLANSIKGFKTRQQTAVKKQQLMPQPQAKKPATQHPLEDIQPGLLSHKQHPERHSGSLEATEKASSEVAAQQPHHLLVAQFKTESNNLNLYEETAKKKEDGLKGGVLGRKTTGLLGRRNDEEMTPSSDNSDKDSGGSSEDLDEQSVADEVIDPEAAAVVLRELSKLCIFKNFGDLEDTISMMSHRSHDNIGYVRSPLIECASIGSPDSDRQGDLMSGVQAEDEEEDGVTSSDNGLISPSPDFEDVSDEMGIPLHGVELLGQEQEQQVIANSSVSGSLSDERLLGLRPRVAERTVPTLQAQAMARLASPFMVTELSVEPLEQQLQTATDKKQKQTRQLANQNKDVTEWLYLANPNDDLGHDPDDEPPLISCQVEDDGSRGDEACPAGEDGSDDLEESSSLAGDALGDGRQRAAE